MAWHWTQEKTVHGAERDWTPPTIRSLFKSFFLSYPSITPYLFLYHTSIHLYYTVLSLYSMPLLYLLSSLYYMKVSSCDVLSCSNTGMLVMSTVCYGFIILSPLLRKVNDFKLLYPWLQGTLYSYISIPCNYKKLGLLASLANGLKFTQTELLVFGLQVCLGVSHE